MRTYNLSFVSDAAIFEHVKNTVLKYRFDINLYDFNNNLIDPIKLTFDSKVYRKSISSVIEAEVIRQLDKSNNNHIGYFHQNLFGIIGNGWEVLEKGYDIVNRSKNIYVEMKNKHNTMNSSSSQKIYMNMQNTILNNPAATCYLVEIIATNSQNIVWETRVDGVRLSNERIRRISIDKFYELVTGDSLSFKKLCEILPTIIEDVVDSIKVVKNSNSVLQELEEINSNILKSLYVLAFSKYEGFDEFEFR